MYKIAWDGYISARFRPWGSSLRIRSVRIPLAAAALMALPSLAAAQFAPPPPPVQNRWPDPPQVQQRTAPEAPPAQQTPARRAPPRAALPRDDDDAPPAPKPKPAPPANVVTCGGIFGKDASHLKLAQKYDSRNVIFTDVDGPDGSKIKATVLYPRDPKRRLELLWQNEASRSDTQVIVITGQSAWSAPRGLKLGMALAAVEKANGRPFALSGFGPDGVASVTGWEDGALAALPGGCKVGLRLAADRNASEAVRKAVTSDSSFLSNDAALRAAKPTVTEILIGY